MRVGAHRRLLILPGRIEAPPGVGQRIGPLAAGQASCFRAVQAQLQREAKQLRAPTERQRGRGLVAASE